MRCNAPIYTHLLFPGEDYVAPADERVLVEVHHRHLGHCATARVKSSAYEYVPIESAKNESCSLYSTSLLYSSKMETRRGTSGLEGRGLFGIAEGVPVARDRFPWALART